MRRAIKNVFSATTLLASLVALGCEGPTEYFRTAQIDPLTMKMNLGGRLTSPPPPGMGFYQRSGAQQGYSVQYFKPDKRVDPDLIMMTAQSVIETKSSLQVLIRGDYSTVYVRQLIGIRQSIRHNRSTFMLSFGSAVPIPQHQRE
jgi:hypothetical protein